MQVTYDLPPDVISAIEGAAGRSHQTVDEYVETRLRFLSSHLDVREYIGDRVCEGLCDADIATELNCPPGRVATIRRSLGLRANKRYPRG
jgi:hypothetical protein